MYCLVVVACREDTAKVDRHCRYHRRGVVGKVVMVGR